MIRKNVNELEIQDNKRLEEIQLQRAVNSKDAAAAALAAANRAVNEIRRKVEEAEAAQVRQRAEQEAQAAAARVAQEAEARASREATEEEMRRRLARETEEEALAQAAVAAEREAAEAAAQAERIAREEAERERKALEAERKRQEKIARRKGRREAAALASEEEARVASELERTRAEAAAAQAAAAEAERARAESLRLKMVALSEEAESLVKKSMKYINDIKKTKQPNRQEAELFDNSLTKLIELKEEIATKPDNINEMRTITEMLKNKYLDTVNVCLKDQTQIRDYTAFIQDFKVQFQKVSGISNVEIDPQLTQILRTIPNRQTIGGCFTIYKFKEEDSINSKLEQFNEITKHIFKYDGSKLIKDDENNKDNKNKYMILIYTKKYAQDLASLKGGQYTRQIEKYKLKIQNLL